MGYMEDLREAAVHQQVQTPAFALLATIANSALARAPVLLDERLDEVGLEEAVPERVEHAVLQLPVPIVREFSHVPEARAHAAARGRP